MPKVTLFHFNDFHRKLEPTRNGAGGAARLVGTLRELKAEHPGSLTANLGDVAGDNAQPGPLAFEPVAELFDRGQVDLLVPGNHEFEDPSENYRSLREGLLEPFDGEVLLANLDFPGTRPYTVRELQGLNIAFIGVVTRDLSSRMFPAAGAGLMVKSIEATLAQLVPKVRAEGADAVVVLAHEGLPEMIDIARATPGVDVALAAHDHQLTQEPVEVVRDDGTRAWVAEAGAYGQAVNQLDLWFSGRTLERVEGRSHPVGEGSPVDPVAERSVAEAPELERVERPTPRKWKEVSWADLQRQFSASSTLPSSSLAPTTTTSSPSPTA